MEVISPEFQQITPVDGKWQGRIKGNGQIALALQILHQGELIEERAMGGTELFDGETTFSFITAFPKQKGWDWNVVARAR